MSLVRLDGAEHAKLRRMVMSEFTARRTRAMHDDIQSLIDGLLDGLEAAGPGADLVEQFTVRLPALVIARMLGVPAEDEYAFVEHSRTIVSSDVTPEQVYGAFIELSAYMDRLTTAKEQNPGNDLLSRLARDHVATGELTHQELVSLGRFLLVAGHETTAHQISLSVLSLLKDPALRAELQGDPSLYKQAGEEFLRYWSIAQDNQVRAAVADVDLGGAQIRKGDGVVLAIPSANHDESVFPGAATLDIHREERRHIAFGYGPHLCPGASLARLELELCLRSLFTRFPTLQLAVPDTELSFRHSGLVYGLDSMPVTW
jgi:cytochrome P450